MTTESTQTNAATITVMIFAGGTGGHIFPALAIAEALRESGYCVIWVGAKGGKEASIATEAGFSFHGLDISALRGKGWQRWLRSPWIVGRSVLQSLRLLRQYCPTFVLGMGGFVSAPGGIAAWLSRCPLLIHEQNAVPGLANRMLAYLASHIMESFPNTFAARYHSVLTGNPLRRGLRAPLPHTSPENRRLRLLVLGGSLGASVLNEVVPQAMRMLPGHFRPEIWHQSGEATFDTAKSHYQKLLGLEESLKLTPFITNMAEAYQWADFAVCRAGAMTLAELSVYGLPAILVPFPHATDHHQMRNAEQFVSVGAGFLIPQQELTPKTLATLIRTFYEEPQRLMTMAEAARSWSRPEATEKVVEVCQAVIKNRL